MTLQQVKLDLISRGFTIVEQPSSEPGGVYLNIRVLDVDGLIVDAAAHVYTHMFENEEDYIGIIKERVVSIEKYISDRHYRNINKCNHIPINVGNQKICTRCMAKLGNVSLVPLMKIDNNAN